MTNSPVQFRPYRVSIDADEVQATMWPVCICNCSLRRRLSAKRFSVIDFGCGWRTPVMLRQVLQNHCSVHRTCAAPKYRDDDAPRAARRSQSGCVTLPSFFRVTSNNSLSTNAWSNRKRSISHMCGTVSAARETNKRRTIAASKGMAMTVSQEKAMIKENTSMGGIDCFTTHQKLLSPANL